MFGGIDHTHRTLEATLHLLHVLTADLFQVELNDPAQLHTLIHQLRGELQVLRTAHSCPLPTATTHCWLAWLTTHWSGGPLHNQSRGRTNGTPSTEHAIASDGQLNLLLNLMLRLLLNPDGEAAAEAAESDAEAAVEPDADT